MRAVRAFPSCSRSFLLLISNLIQGYGRALRNATVRSGASVPFACRKGTKEKQQTAHGASQTNMFSCLGCMMIRCGLPPLEPEEATAAGPSDAREQHTTGAGVNAGPRRRSVRAERRRYWKVAARLTLNTTVPFGTDEISGLTQN